MLKKRAGKTTRGTSYDVYENFSEKGALIGKKVRFSRRVSVSDIQELLGTEFMMSPTDCVVISTDMDMSVTMEYT